MSEFDKEAEREKLREKYAKDREDREATQRMSDLLLRGATMTNRHCDACGDPVFRYEGQEFCPSCQGTGQGTEPTDGQPESATSPDSGADPESETAARAVADEERTDPVDTASQPSEVRESEPEPARAPSEPDSSREPVPATRPATGDDPSDARAELRRTIATLARRAGDSEDPRRAREFLAAAGEAADALSTLEGR